jgi:hypothetical protein
MIVLEILWIVFLSYLIFEGLLMIFQDLSWHWNEYKKGAGK